MEPRRVLLVCNQICKEVENYLHHAGCQVTRVSRGTAAVDRARHETLDAAVLISTGPEMDLAETALNLRDIKPSIAIVIIADRQSAVEEADQTGAIAHAVPRIRVLTVDELGHYLDSPEWNAQLTFKPTR